MESLVPISNFVFISWEPSGKKKESIQGLSGQNCLLSNKMWFLLFTPIYNLCYNSDSYIWTLQILFQVYVLALKYRYLQNGRQIGPVLMMESHTQSKSFWERRVSRSHLCRMLYTPEKTVLHSFWLLEHKMMLNCIICLTERICSQLYL